jgi:hypothetical protein
MAAESNIKCQARQLKEHFQKLLEATCLNHSNSVRHNLKDCTMIKKFMTLGALSRGKKPEGDPAGKV